MSDELDNAISMMAMGLLIKNLREENRLFENRIKKLEALFENDEKERTDAIWKHSEELLKHT